MHPTLKHISDIDSAKTAELARLRAVNAELLAALREIAEATSRQQLPLTAQIYEAARAAIAKASEVTP